MALVEHNIPSNLSDFVARNDKSLVNTDKDHIEVIVGKSRRVVYYKDYRRKLQRDTLAKKMVGMLKDLRSSLSGMQFG